MTCQFWDRCLERRNRDSPCIYSGFCRRRVAIFELENIDKTKIEITLINSR